MNRIFKSGPSKHSSQQNFQENEIEIKFLGWVIFILWRNNCDFLLCRKRAPSWSKWEKNEKSAKILQFLWYSKVIHLNMIILYRIWISIFYIFYRIIEFIPIRIIASIYGVWFFKGDKFFAVLYTNNIYG